MASDTWEWPLNKQSREGDTISARVYCCRKMFYFTLYIFEIEAPKQLFIPFRDGLVINFELYC